ncbi:MAG: DUF2357 domain-containing protein [Bacteroidota bacterium]|jgi:predicted component of viral defense system (DUF524 family)
MDLLRLEHTDFVLLVNCSRPEMHFRRARQRQPDLLHATGYQLRGAQGYVLLPDTNNYLQLKESGLHPVFFENKQYTFWIEFKAPQAITDACVKDRRAEIEEAFTWHRKSGVLSGTINFMNDIGKSALTFSYKKQNIEYTSVFHFEVFPIKLDYKKHYRELVFSINKLYPNLIYDFLRKTYSQFRPGNSENTDLIWWRIFSGLYEDFVKSAYYILQHPGRKLQQDKQMVKAGRLTELTPSLEEELAENKCYPDYLYRSPAHHYTLDIPENRFVKYAVQQTGQRFSKLCKLILSNYSRQISPSFRTEIESKEKQMQSLMHNPVLRNFGEYKGLRQESLVLQQATGYSTLYRIWHVLRAGSELFDGIQQIEFKSIDNLYQIWCFLEMSSIITRILQTGPEVAELAKFSNHNFVVGFETGKASKISWTCANGDRVILYHDIQFGRNASEKIRSYTIAQRPDIVLQIVKNDLREAYSLTYLFDAKYRLQSDDSPAGSDSPPDDAINQMHRYRDAIFYSDHRHNLPRKEIIGAYVLFPGNSDAETAQKSHWYMSIEKVNVGAFQLLPGSENSGILLRRFLEQILFSGSEETLKNLIAHKGVDYEPVNPDILVGVIKRSNQARYFDTDSEPLYHTGPVDEHSVEEWLRFTTNLRFFAPRYSGLGIKAYYEIAGIQISRRCDIFPPGHILYNQDDTSIRIVLKLHRKRFLNKNQTFIPCENKTYGYTTFSGIRSVDDLGIRLNWDF